MTRQHFTRLRLPSHVRGRCHTAAAMEGQRTCQTAPNCVFESVDELKAHYKSDWHRYNLKRKARRRFSAARHAAREPP